MHTYKQENMKETMLKTKKKTDIDVLDSKPIGSLTLDQIEENLDKLAQTECTSLVQAALIESKMKQYVMSADFKFKKLQIKALMQDAEPVDVKPLEVKFISSKTSEQLERVQRIENQVKDGRTIKQDA